MPPVGIGYCVPRHEIDRVAPQDGQLVLQIQSPEQVRFLTGKELDQEVHIAFLMPVSKDGTENPQCFHRGTSAELDNFIDGQAFTKKLIRVGHLWVFPVRFRNLLCYSLVSVATERNWKGERR